MPSTSEFPATTTERGVRIALMFALVAERLSIFYAHDQWLREAQGATLAAEWLARSKRQLPLTERKRLSDLSDRLARRIAATLSREAGLYTAHEMMESLTTDTLSEPAQSLMLECERLLDEIVET